MNRRHALLAPCLVPATLAACAARPAGPAPRTRWVFRTSEGMDALAFLGPLSGKDFYARYYGDERAAFAPRLDAAAREALASLVQQADADGYLLWPQLALVFSGGPDRTLDDLLASLADAERVLRPPFEAGIYWDATAWQRFSAARPRIGTVLTGLRSAGFGDFWREHTRDAAATVAGLHARLDRYDVIAEQQRLMARPLEPTITVELLRFCRPHGVKVQGQRMLAHLDASDEVMLLTAAHEMLHPPFDPRGRAAQAGLAVLRDDPLFARILAEKSPETGYNSLDGILDEDTVQALDQIVQERLGKVLRPAAERWRASDEGMHVLAAGLYGLLKADGFDRRGGDIEAWLEAAARDGRLAPAGLHAAAAAVLGRPAEALWQRPVPLAG